MNLKKLLSEDTVILELKGTTKDAIIQEMIDLLVARGRIKDREAALKAVMEREQKMSTGMQHGIAIPHGKTDSVDKLVTAMAMKKEGVDFGSMDGKPSTIFIMTISSVSRTGPHIQFLSEISQVLNDPEKRERILLAQSTSEVMEILTT
ncbi:MAG: PTS sugar transporter subunit IIA [bacterium]|jgi:fructose-specific phosphotransferase system IIA component